MVKEYVPEAMSSSIPTVIDKVELAPLGATDVLGPTVMVNP